MNIVNKTVLGVSALLVTIIACNNNEEQPKEEKIAIPPAFDVSQIDSTIMPCEDFEKFAVGNWLKNNPIPTSESRWSSFNIVHNANEVKLRAIVDEAAKAKAEKGTLLQQVGDFYTAALDSTTTNELGITPLRPLLDKIDAVTTPQELVEMMVETKKVGSSSIFGYYVSIDSKNSEQYITYLSQGGLGLPDKDYYTPNDERGITILNEYKKHITALFILAKKEESTAKKYATDVIEIESFLADKAMSNIERRDPEKTYNKLTVSELQNLSSTINWDAFFTKAELKGIENLVLNQPDYFKSLNEGLHKFPIENWKTYMKWHLINDMASNLSIEFERQVFSFYSTTLYDVKTMKPRWKRALSKTNASVGEQLGKLFVEKHFPEESKQKVLDLINNISAVFKERVQNLGWMSDSTKRKALEKLSKFNYKIGYPDKWEDYRSVDIQANALVQNVMNMNAFEYTKNVNRIGTPIDKKQWRFPAHTINAGYDPTLNEIVFPAGILQPPFFDPNADDAINYGGIGAVIGHEFSHGFDDEGGKYDGDGNLKKWWNEEDLANFNKETSKLVNQFNTYTVAEGNHVNGKLTLGENIADLAGLTLSYHALEKVMKEKKDPMIDGYTYQQRFFLGWAQVWHMNAKDAYLINQVKTDPHSPTRYRIIGPLTNMVEFHNAFGCKGSKMVASDSLRVSIW